MNATLDFARWRDLVRPDGGKPRLFCSFSGGRTSGVMTKKCLDAMSEHFEIVVGFANTGQEDERTLRFVHQCDQIFGFRTVWLEAVVNPEMGAGTTHRIVTYETASRHGEPFEAVIQNYGIPHHSFPHCTREMKLQPMESYLRSIGWSDYYTAIGIRPDESRRVNKKATKHKFIYPLIDFFWMDKQDVNDWWKDQPFDLEILEHEGNCKTCWKKSDPKLFRLLREQPESFQFFDRMEKRYPRVGPEFVKDPTRPDRVFFRRGRSTQNMIAAAEALADVPVAVLERRDALDADTDGGCSESCELFPMEEA